jgi:hypothetical protein
MLRTNVWVRLVETNPAALIRDLRTGVFRFARWNMDFMVSSERKELADFLKPGRSFVMRGALGSGTQVTGMLQLVKVLSQWTIKGGEAAASGASGGRQGGAGEEAEDGVVVVSGGMGDEGDESLRSRPSRGGEKVMVDVHNGIWAMVRFNSTAAAENFYQRFRHWEASGGQIRQRGVVVTMALLTEHLVDMGLAEQTHLHKDRRRRVMLSIPDDYLEETGISWRAVMAGVGKMDLPAPLIQIDHRITLTRSDDWGGKPRQVRLGRRVVLISFQYASGPMLMKERLPHGWGSRARLLYAIPVKPNLNRALHGTREWRQIPTMEHHRRQQSRGAPAGGMSLRLEPALGVVAGGSGKESLLASKKDIKQLNSKMDKLMGVCIETFQGVLLVNESAEHVEEAVDGLTVASQEHSLALMLQYSETAKSQSVLQRSGEMQAWSGKGSKEAKTAKVKTFNLELARVAEVAGQSLLREVKSLSQSSSVALREADSRESWRSWMEGSAGRLAELRATQSKARKRQREVEGDGAGDRRAAKAAPSGTSPVQ